MQIYGALKSLTGTAHRNTECGRDGQCHCWLQQIEAELCAATMAFAALFRWITSRFNCFLVGAAALHNDYAGDGTLLSYLRVLSGSPDRRGHCGVPADPAADQTDSIRH